MSIDFLRRTALFVILCLAQVLVLGNIHLLGFATPLPYLYLVLLLPLDYPRWAMLLWGFAEGLAIDIFSNTPGVASGSMTFLALLRPVILAPFVPRDSDENMKPGVKAMGAGSFFYYSLICSVVYCAVFFSLEIFNIICNWRQWLMSVGGSAALTVLFILAMESIRSR